MRLPAPTETLTSDYPQESEPGLLVRVLRAKGHRGAVRKFHARMPRVMLPRGVERPTEKPAYAHGSL